MEDLRSIDFRVHLALSHVLNLHLQDNVVSRSKFEALEKRLLEIDKIAKEAKKLANKKAAPAQTGRGNGMQGGNLGPRKQRHLKLEELPAGVKEGVVDQVEQ